MRRLNVVAGVYARAVAALALLILAAAPAFAAAPPRPGAPAPPFALPIVVNGHGAISLASLRGHPVYLNFFANWCQPCQDEGRTLRKLSIESKRRGVVMIGIATLDSIAGAKAFAKKFGLKYPIVVDGSSTVGAAYGVSTLPEQVFITADGTVKSWSIGPETPASGTAALRAIGASK